MTERIAPNLGRILRDLLILLAMTLALRAAVARGDSVRLLDQAVAPGPQVRLEQVAELEGVEARKLASLVVGEVSASQRECRLSLENLRELLTRRGINWSRLSLRGYAACRVEWSSPASAPESGEAPAALAVNPKTEVTLESSLTLRDRLVELIARLSGIERSDLKVKFADADAPALALSTLVDRFEFEPQSATGLGRVPVTVRRWRGDRMIETLHLTADVSRRVLAVVATRHISRGQTFAPSDLEVREVFLDASQGTPVTDPAGILGQNAAAMLRQGAVVLTSQVRSPVVVKRGDMMTIRCVSGGMVIKTVGRAGEDGAVGQLVLVRNERSRDTMRVRVTGPLEGVLAVEGQAREGAAAR